LNYNNAQAYCRSIGMELFAVTTNDEWNGLVSLATANFGVTSPGAVIWINGVQDASGVWSVYNPGQKPFLSSKAPSGSYVSGSNCMDFTNWNVPWFTVGKSCLTAQSFFCELKKY
jgi:hypothetical protein